MSKLLKLREEKSELLNEAKGLADKETLTDDEQKRWNELSEADGLIAKKQSEIEAEERKEEIRKEQALDQKRQKDDADNIKDSDAVGKGEDASRFKTEVKSKDTNSKAAKEKRNIQTFRLLQGIMRKDPSLIQSSQRSLASEGHFDDYFEEKGEKFSEERSFNTLIDQDGAILVPSSITSETFDIMQEYGIIPRLALNLGDISQSTVKAPNILGRPSFYAVSQGGAIQGSGFNLGGIELKALKWGCIIPWTNEVSDSVASRLMPIIMNKIGEAYAFAQDDTFFNGDGTSSYNGIKGLENLTGQNYVTSSVADTGDATFATVDADDWNAAIYDVAPGVRSGSVFAMHPNMVEHLHNLQDGQGEYIYGKPSEVRPAGSLWGYPIELSEACPITDGASKTYAFFFNPRHVAYGTGRNLSAEELREGTITDENSNSVNLATTDQKALRFTGLFDIKLDNNTRSTGGTTQGAFAVLKTAAS